jgi:hypothetical protein
MEKLQTNKLLDKVMQFFMEPLQSIPSYLKEMIDEFTSLKTVYKIVTVIVLMYLALPPLLYNADPVEFHLIKLNTMYITGSLLFLIVIFGYQNFPYLREVWTIYRRGRNIIFISIFVMLFSLAINFPQMNLFVRAEVVTTPVFYGAGPNFISIFYYWLAFVLLLVAPTIIPHLPMKLVTTAVYASLTITAGLIAYQVLINDFMGVSRTYLFGFGNTNYTPDPFAIFGLFLTIPLLYKQKINPWTVLLGIFFFVIVLLSISRASWVGLTVSILATISLLVKLKKVDLKRVGILTITGITVLLLMVGILSIFGETVIIDNFNSVIRLLTGESGFAETSSNRTLLWVSAIEMWVYGVADGTEVFGPNVATLLFGNGQSVYIWVEGTTQYLVTNVHQMYLDVLMSAGIVVFIAFMYGVIQFIKMSYQLVLHDVNNILLFSGLIFILTKWFFNSLNGLHAPFVYVVLFMILYRYMFRTNPKLR